MAPVRASRRKNDKIPARTNKTAKNAKISSDFTKKTVKSGLI